MGYITAQEGGGAWGVHLHTSQTNQNNYRAHMTNGPMKMLQLNKFNYKRNKLGHNK